MIGDVELNFLSGEFSNSTIYKLRPKRKITCEPDVLVNEPVWVKNANVWRFFRTSKAIEAEFNGHLLLKQTFDDCSEMTSDWKNIDKWYLRKRPKNNGLSWTETDIGEFSTF